MNKMCLFCLTRVPHKRRGRPLLLGSDLDDEVQIYLKKVREGGGVISSRIVMATAKGIVLSCDKSKLVEYGGHIRYWAYSLLTHKRIFA